MGNAPKSYKFSEKTVEITDSSGNVYPIKTITVYKRYVIYKGADIGMNTEADYEKFIRIRSYTDTNDKPFDGDPIIPSWYGLEKTAKKYGNAVDDKTVYMFEFIRDATFIDVTDLNTMKNLVKYINNIKTVKNVVNLREWKEQLIKEINIITGACSLRQQAFDIESAKMEYEDIG